jgi:hypothetical protein
VDDHLLKLSTLNCSVPLQPPFTQAEQPRLIDVIVVCDMVITTHIHVNRKVSWVEEGLRGMQLQGSVEGFDPWNFLPLMQYKNLYVTHRVKFLYFHASKFDLELLDLWTFPPFNVLKIKRNES